MKQFENEINSILQQNDAIYYDDLNDINTNGLTASIGKNTGGDIITIDFLKNPHLLVGGSSGSGKSCLINCIVKSLLNKYKDIYFLIVDVKRVEFMDYKNNKQIIATAHTSTEAYNYFEKFINIMYNRFNQLEKKGAKNITEYNKNTPEAEQMKHFFILVDETADLLLDNKNIKTQLQKLTQLGRAVGLHVITATQAPNCKTIPTEIKININARIALQVPNASNSKIIIDMSGAEKLNRPGDAILKINNTSDTFRVALV